MVIDLCASPLKTDAFCYVGKPHNGPLITSSPGIANEQKKLYGTQFHPEVDLTERGMEMLRNFLFEIAGCTSNFTVQNRQQSCINEIREKADKSKVLVSETAQSSVDACVGIQTILFPRGDGRNTFSWLNLSAECEV